MTIEASVDIPDKNICHVSRSTRGGKTSMPPQSLPNHANDFVVHDALIISWIVACYAAMWAPSPHFFFLLVGITTSTLVSSRKEDGWNGDGHNEVAIEFKMVGGHDFKVSKDAAVLCLLPGGGNITVSVESTVRDLLNATGITDSVRTVTFFGRMLNEQRKNLNLLAFDISPGNIIRVLYTVDCKLLGGMRHSHSDVSILNEYFTLCNPLISLVIDLKGFELKSGS